MAKFYDEIPESLIEWINNQHMFWVASAPLSPDGHVNLSAKGTADSFHVVNSHRVWYQDLSKSGMETISQNGRITILFNAFEGPPRILRLFGIGTVYECGTEEYESLISPEIRKPGSRAVIVIDVYQCQMSCGYAVPLYDFVARDEPVAPNSSEWLIRKSQLTALQTQRPVKKVSKHIRHDRT